MFFKALSVALAVGSAVAQRPDNTTVCDYYTTLLLKNNTATNQRTVLTLVVNTAIIGNYSNASASAVPGILAKGTFGGVDVDLAPYFTGALASTNTGGKSGMAVNFLDGGGAAPLMENLPANDTSSNQYILVTHLYEYFGALLQCSKMGNDDYPAYNGADSMYEVHKFMDLSAAEVGYFITQVALSAASFGVAESDLTIVGTALSTLFGQRCSAATTVIPGQDAQLQAICIDSTCPIATNATCDSYATAEEPVSANSSNIATTTRSASSTATRTATTTGTGTGSATSGTAAATSTNGAAHVGLSVAAVAGGVFALFL